MPISCHTDSSGLPISNRLLNKSIIFSGKVGAVFPAHSYILINSIISS